MISDGQKFALLAVFSLLGVLVGFRVTNSLNTNDEHFQAVQAAGKHVLLEKQESNQVLSSGAAVPDLPISQPPKWKLVIEKVCCALRVAQNFGG